MPQKRKAKYKYDIIAEQIMGRIKDGVWKIGDKLPPEHKLVDEFGVSRVTLRESLKKLDMMGVLQIVQGDGTYVREVVPAEFMKPLLPLMTYNSDNINEVYNARIFVEGGACKLAAERRTEKDVQQLALLLNNMEDAIAFNNYEEYSEYDYAFHEYVLRVSGNGIMVTIVGMFKDIVSEYIQKINQEEQVVARSMSDHWQILWAISDKNGEMARSIMENHLHRSRNVLLNKLDTKV